MENKKYETKDIFVGMLLQRVENPKERIEVGFVDHMVEMCELNIVSEKTKPVYVSIKTDTILNDLNSGKLIKKSIWVDLKLEIPITIMGCFNQIIPEMIFGFNLLANKDVTAVNSDMGKHFEVKFPKFGNFIIFNIIDEYFFIGGIEIHKENIKKFMLMIEEKYSMEVIISKNSIVINSKSDKKYGRN